MQELNILTLLSYRVYNIISEDSVMKKFLLILLILIVGVKSSFAATFEPIPNDVNLPKKYTQDYVDSLINEYEKVAKDQIFHVALDMLKETCGEYSRKAILGYNLTQRPIQIEFIDLSELNPAYSSYDAVGWKKKKRLFIYINPKHRNAPPGALAALLAHEALHQDEYNSLTEETYAWTMEASTWCEILKRYPESNNLESPLVTRENILKQQLEKGNYTNKYIKKTVYANDAYKSLPLTSPGFDESTLVAF